MGKTRSQLGLASPAVAGAAVSLLAASCGAGVVGVAATSGGGGGSSTPTLTAFDVLNPKVSPATLRLDASASVVVELSYQRPGGIETPMTTLAGPGVSASQVQLPAGASTLTWNFAAELGGPGFAPDVDLFARHPNGTLLEGGSLHLGMGNDAPIVHAVEPMPTDPQDPSESAGNVEIRLRISDSSSDPVDVRVQWRRASDPPNAWNDATAAGVFPDGVETSPAPGVQLSFFWNTNVDLADEEDSVLFRVTADDRTDPSAPFETQAPFHVDNNAAPIVQLDSGPLILNPDERRGIPIPFRVIDEEGDLVDVIFQWRHEDEEFPSLDTDGNGKVTNAEIDAILADRVLRQEHHICTEYPRFAKGRVVPIDDHTVRLPELASSESWILASGIVGKTLELLRPSSIPAPITPTWRSNPLVSPIAALPVGDGLTALVLDVPGNGRLREIELATGKVIPHNGRDEIATFAAGIPTAMAYEHREKAVLLALDDAGTWRIERVGLATGAITELIVSDGTEPAPVRGIASLGTNVAVFTAGSSLFQLDYRDPLAPQVGRLLTGLASPWGVVVDPLSHERLYLAERGANRLLALDLDSLGKLPVVVKTADMQLGTLDAPGSIALEGSGARMLIVTGTTSGVRQLLALDIGATGVNTFPVGAPMAVDVDGVVTGSNELRLLWSSASSDILVAGGIEQRRTIAAHSISAQEVSVEPRLDPASSAGRLWCIPREPRLRASAEGAAGCFVWDSTDAPGTTFLRAAARDDEVGALSDGAAAKRVRSGLERAPVALGGFPVMRGPGSVVAADLDGDGALDLVSANETSDNLTALFQAAPGIFGSNPLVIDGSLTTDAPHSVAAADLDGDGDLDLATANATSDDLTAFFQLAPRSFAATPLRLGGLGTTDSPFSVAAADLDGDGDLDLVSGNVRGNDLTVFFQLAQGTFSATPLVLGGRGTTNGPGSIAVADLDSDGDLDLASANQFGASLTFFVQLTPGTFGATPLTLGSTATTNEPKSIAAADFDGDGDQDLVSANGFGNNDLTVFFQLGPRSFAPTPLTLGGPSTTETPRLVAAADLDDDGDQDLVTASRDALPIFFQLGPGSFTATPLALAGPAVSVALGDLDGDGRQDLVSANGSSDDLSVFLQLAPGSFAATPLTVGGGLPTVGPSSVAAGDLDGDGDLDLVSANSDLEGDNDSLAAFFQLASGSFGTTPLTLGGPATTDAPSSIVAADLDGDADLDIVSANYRSGDLTVFFQLAPGSFARTPLALGSLGGPRSVAAADLDGDGDLDLASASEFGNVALFFQLTHGGFGATPLALGSPPTTNGPRSIAAADLDGDGDLDLVSANARSDNLTAFFQLAPGSFGSTPLVLGGHATTDSPFSVAVADLDGDGDQDIVSANSDSDLFPGESDDLTVFFQLAPGSFSATPLALGANGVTDFPSAVTAADLDGDGDQDLVSANEIGSNLSLFFQLPSGSFATEPLRIGGPGTTVRPLSVVVTDLDGDGDRDLISANSLSGNLTVFWSGR